MSTFEHIITGLPGLSPDQLTQLKARINGLLPRESAAVDNFETRVLGTICDVLEARVGARLHIQQLRRSGGAAAFRDKLRDLQAFLASVSAKSIVQQAVLRIGVDLLYADLVRMRGSAEAPLMMANIHRIPAVIDRQFPGYAKAGMLSWIVQVQRSE